MRHELASRIVRLVAAVGLVAGVVGISAAPSGAATRWAITPSVSPPGPPQGELSGVSCTSATDCFAVGDTGSGTLIEHWDGTAWKFVASPNPKNGIEAALSAVACTSPTNCMAVGGSGLDAPTLSSGTLAERWDGTSWTILPSPVPHGANDLELNAISCTSATNCFAVGGTETFTISPPALTGATLIEHWDGTTWSIVSSPSPTGTIEAAFLGVSCPSPTNCFAVGDYEGHATEGALMEHWNGAAWSIVPNPDSTAAVKAAVSIPILVGGFGSSPSLSSVSCSSDASCFAVGESTSGALIERWDGTTWTFLDSPTPRNSDGAQLTAVSCSSATDCSAVGNADSEIGVGTLTSGDGITDFGGTPVTEHWNGASWVIVAQPPGKVFGELSGVACPTTTSCAAVGDSTLVQRWNGVSWSIAPSATKTSESHLNQVACRSANNCFAVGAYDTNTRTNTLIEHWNGSSWSISPSPSPSGAEYVELIGISCGAATSCFAVGYTETSSGQQALIERWNGATWTIAKSPKQNADDFVELTSVSCASATSCNAIGFEDGDVSSTTLAEHWNGTTWSIVATPSPKSGAILEMEGISCPTATDCTAVGSADVEGPESESAQPAIEHWDGTKWSVVPSPKTAGGGFSTLISVSCSSPTNCVAAGITALDVEDATKSIAEHWDGKTWKLLAAPASIGSDNTELVGVSCRSTASCYLVGGKFNTAAGGTLVEHWNGTTLSVVPSANPTIGTGAALTGVSCPSSTACLAVGRYSALDGSFTLAERGA